MWVSTGGSATLLRFDPEDIESGPIAEITAPDGGAFYGLTDNGSRIWAVGPYHLPGNYVAAGLFLIDAGYNAVFDSRSAPGETPGNPAFANGILYVPDAVTNIVTTVDYSHGFHVSTLTGELSLKYQLGDVSFADPGFRTNLRANRLLGAVTNPRAQHTVNFGVDTGGGASGAAADYAVILGGNRHYVESPWGVIVGGFFNQIDDESERSFIGGGSDHTIMNSVQSVIVGGEDNHIGDGSNQYIGGGRSNRATNERATVVGGYNNNAYGINSFVGAGSLNNAGGQNSTVAGGQFNQTLTDYQTIGGGSNNSASDLATYATIPGGAGAFASRVAQFAYAGGVFSSIGDAQYSRYFVKGVSVNGSSVAPADENGNQFTLENNHSYAVRAVIHATRIDGGDARAMWIRDLLVHCTADTAYIDEENKTLDVPNGTSWTVAFSTSGSDIQSEFVGNVGEEVRVLVMYEWIEIGFF